jgi:hypothetical protein
MKEELVRIEIANLELKAGDILVARFDETAPPAVINAAYATFKRVLPKGLTVLGMIGKNIQFEVMKQETEAEQVKRLAPFIQDAINRGDIKTEWTQ